MRAPWSMCSRFEEGVRVFLLPLPACGERVGVRGPLHKGGLAEREGAFLRSSDSRRGPLTRNLREERANSDLSTQAGRGKGPACDERSDSLLLPAAIRSPRDQNV